MPPNHVIVQTLKPHVNFNMTNIKITLFQDVMIIGQKNRFVCLWEGEKLYMNFTSHELIHFFCPWWTQRND